MNIKDPIQEAKELTKQAKLQQKIPYWGRGKELRDLRLKEFKKDILEKDIQSQAIDLDKILGLRNIDYAKSLIKKYGSLSNAILAVQHDKDEISGTLGNYIQSKPYPVMDRPATFINEVIREAYPTYSDVYHSSDRVADALREYVRISREYKDDLEDLTRKLDNLTLVLSHSMDIPRHELRPLVHTVVPLALREPNFF